MTNIQELNKTDSTNLSGAIVPLLLVFNLVSLPIRHTLTVSWRGSCEIFHNLYKTNTTIN